MSTTRLIACFMACCLAILAAGCSSTLKVRYSPVSPPMYTEKVPVQVTIGTVTDDRGMDAAVYWTNGFDKSSYDRSVADAVKEALRSEFQRAGMCVSPEGSGASKALTLNCKVLDFRAQLTIKPFRSSTVDEVVTLRFQLVDPSTGMVLDESDRTEKRTIQLGWGDNPQLPFQAAQIEGYVNDLVNSLLPDAIEKELRLTKWSSYK